MKMPKWEIEVEPIAVAHVTGRLGTAIVTYRNHEYRVTLGGKQITRDGYPCGVDCLPKAVYDYAVKQYDALLAEYTRRNA